MSKAGSSKPSFFEQLSAFGAVYWTANWMELVERFAYYGVRTVLPVFMVLAISEGGPVTASDARGGRKRASTTGDTARPARMSTSMREGSKGEGKFDTKPTPSSRATPVTSVLRSMSNTGLTSLRT